MLRFWVRPSSRREPQPAVAGPQVVVGAADRERQALDHERVELRVRRGVEVGRRVRRHEDRVVGAEVVVLAGRRVRVRGRVDHVLLGEAAVLVHRRGIGEHAARDPVQVLRDQRDLVPAALQHDHARPQPRVLAGGLRVGADPAHHVVARGRGDVGAPPARCPRRRGRVHRRAGTARRSMGRGAYALPGCSAPGTSSNSSVTQVAAASAERISASSSKRRSSRRPSVRTVTVASANGHGST